MAVGETRLAAQRGTVLGCRLVDTAQILEQDAEVEQQQFILRVMSQGCAIRLLGLLQLVGLVQQATEIDACGGMARIDAQRLAIALDRRVRVGGLGLPCALEPRLGRGRGSAQT